MTAKDATKMPTHELNHQFAVLHDHGATLAFDPVGATHVFIMIGAHKTQDGLKYYRNQELGPWGNTDILAGDARPGFDQMRDDAVNAAWEYVRALQEGVFDNKWTGKIIDQRSN
jgi:hypothetical protein